MLKPYTDIANLFLLLNSTGHLMQIFSIPKNACLISNFISLYIVKIASNSHYNTSNFKLAFPACRKIYFIVLAVLVLLLCLVKESNFFCATWYKIQLIQISTYQSKLDGGLTFFVTMNEGSHHPLLPFVNCFVPR